MRHEGEDAAAHQSSARARTGLRGYCMSRTYAGRHVSSTYRCWIPIAVDTTAMEILANITFTPGSRRRASSSLYSPPACAHGHLRHDDSSLLCAFTFADNRKRRTRLRHKIPIFSFIFRRLSEYLFLTSHVTYRRLPRLPQHRLPFICHDHHAASCREFSDGMSAARVI